MNFRRSSTLIIYLNLTMIVACCLLSACSARRAESPNTPMAASSEASSGTAAVSPASVATSVAPPEPSPTETETTEPSWVIPGFTMTTMDGYTARVSDISITYSTLPSIDVANAKPGHAIVKDGKVEFAGSITNTTKGHNFESPDGLALVGYERISSPSECRNEWDNVVRTRRGSILCQVADVGGLLFVDGADVAKGLVPEDSASFGQADIEVTSSWSGTVAESAAQERLEALMDARIVWIVDTAGNRTDVNTTVRESRKYPIDWWDGSKWSDPPCFTDSHCPIYVLAATEPVG